MKAKNLNLTAALSRFAASQRANSKITS